MSSVRDNVLSEGIIWDEGIIGFAQNMMECRPYHHSFVIEYNGKATRTIGFLPRFTKYEDDKIFFERKWTFCHIKIL